jgi:hypothetical protein
MKRTTLVLVSATALALVCFLIYRSTIWGRYNRIKVGMSLREVQTLLGPGEPVQRAHVPQVPPYVKPEVNGECAPVVDGDVFYAWYASATGDGVIYIGFCNGHVCDKNWLRLGL